MKRIMSFDVGIKNMAYCVFDVSAIATVDSPPFTISDWNVLDLTDSSASANGRTGLSSPCTYMLPLPVPKKKSKKATSVQPVAQPQPQPPKTCGKMSKYMKNTHFFCEKHAKCSGFIPYKKEYTSTALNKKKKEDLVKLAHTQFLSVDASANKSVIQSSLQSHFSAKMLEPIVVPKRKTADETDLISIGRQIKIQLDRLTYLPSITHVIIENQISPIANRMKTIQGMLTQYFIMTGHPDIQIVFISSANKLKRGNPRGNLGFPSQSSRGNPGFPSQPSLSSQPSLPTSGEPCLDTSRGNPGFPSQPSLPTSEEPSLETPSVAPSMNELYRKHKKDGVALCTQFIEDHEWMHSWRDVMLHRKKDDYADSFLQGVWYIQHKMK